MGLRCLLGLGHWFDWKCLSCCLHWHCMQLAMFFAPSSSFYHLLNFWLAWSCVSGFGLWYQGMGTRGFPGSSAGKESICNAGDPGLIPGSGRSPGEEVGYLLHYSWASLMAQIVKNLLVVWETWVQSLGWEDPLEEGMATHSSILTWRIPMDRGACWTTVHRVARSQTWLSDSAQHRR